MSVFGYKISKLKVWITKWAKHNYGDFNVRIEQVQEAIRLLEEKDQVTRVDEQEWERLLRLMAWEKNLQNDKESVAKFGLKLKWLESGDVNSAFFHKSIAMKRAADRGKRKRAQVAGITLDKVIQYYSELWNEQNQEVGREGGVESLLSVIQSKVSDAHNERLTRELAREELDMVVEQLKVGKAAGLDGFGADFYKKFWPILREEFWGLTGNFLRRGIMPDSWKETMVVMIPKVREPRSEKDFRPISMVSTAYKIISKVLVNRWREIIGEYINIAQKGFIPGRDISEASMIVQECWHTMERRMKNRKKIFIAKIDMEKAYDRVRWPFLEAALRATGYCNTWITWMMACVKDAAFKITMDGEMSELIRVSNGLRQGDPLSPFLFCNIWERAFGSAGSGSEEWEFRRNEV